MMGPPPQFEFLQNPGTHLVRFEPCSPPLPKLLLQPLRRRQKYHQAPWPQWRSVSNVKTPATTTAPQQVIGYDASHRGCDGSDYRQRGRDGGRDGSDYRQRGRDGSDYRQSGCDGSDYRQRIRPLHGAARGAPPPPNPSRATTSGQNGRHRVVWRSGSCGQFVRLRWLVPRGARAPEQGVFSPPASQTSLLPHAGLVRPTLALHRRSVTSLRPLACSPIASLQ
eukprot:scaffold28073_cov54-Phaeocystis_antarctica.AAC.4